MSQTTRAKPRPLLAAACVFIAASACSNHPPQHATSAPATSGGESGLSRAGKQIDQAHRNFQDDVKPAATWVDEKTNTVVNEVKKAARKSADAIANEH